MLDMNQANAVSYAWEASGLTEPEKLLAEFHGHTIRVGEEPGQVKFYKQGRYEASEGYLIAPFAGVHGWYLSNESDSAITVFLSLYGNYMATMRLQKIAINSDAVFADRCVSSPGFNRLACNW